MAKERIVRATFADGTTKERGSVSRVYTHGWRVVVKYTEDYKAERAKHGWMPSDGFTEYGFSGSAELARKAAASFKYPDTQIEVVPVVEIAKRGEAV